MEDHGYGEELRYLNRVQMTCERCGATSNRDGSSIASYGSSALCRECARTPGEIRARRALAIALAPIWLPLFGIAKVLIWIGGLKYRIKSPFSRDPRDSVPEEIAPPSDPGDGLDDPEGFF